MILSSLECRKNRVATQCLEAKLHLDKDPFMSICSAATAQALDYLLGRDSSIDTQTNKAYASEVSPIGTKCSWVSS